MLLSTRRGGQGLDLIRGSGSELRMLPQDQVDDLLGEAACKTFEADIPGLRNALTTKGEVHVKNRIDAADSLRSGVGSRGGCFRDTASNTEMEPMGVATPGEDSELSAKVGLLGLADGQTDSDKGGW